MNVEIWIGLLIEDWIEALEVLEGGEHIPQSSFTINFRHLPTLVWYLII